MLAYVTPGSKCFPPGCVSEIKCPNSEDSLQQPSMALCTTPSLPGSDGFPPLLPPATPTQSLPQTVQLGFHLLGSCLQIMHNLPLALQD